MKKHIFLFLAVSLFMGLNAKTIYLNTGGNELWEADGANKFAAWHWGSGEGQWSEWMIRLTGNVWQVEIDDNSDKVVFCRFNNGATTPHWNDDMWNQTEDLVIGANNMFSITAWKKEGCEEEKCKSQGAWSAYTPAEIKYHIAGNGSTGNTWCCEADWKADGCELDKDTHSKTFKDVPQGTYQFKITDGTWDTTWGASNMNGSESSEGWKAGENNNVVFTTNSESDITVSFDPKKGTIKLTVAAGIDEFGDQKFYIAGNGTAGNPWCCEADWQADGCELDKDTYSKTFKDVPQGVYRFKITNGKWDENEGGASWGASNMNSLESTSGWKSSNDNNIVFKTKATGDITVSFDPKTESIKLAVAGGIDEDLYTGGVPSQCTDVLMQGFYYNSYEVNDTAKNGTDLYGDTKWRTLYKQSGEIGAYFDLIWLPPSALSSGTGYYPRQYSNQNSDWGSRTELESLIAAFHNSGTKVVADVVLDHFIAMSGWCDFATMNFGKYGTYKPDMSWICKTDEINTDESKKKDAGDCFGKATGDDDEGDNNDGARDLAHSKIPVQNFSKAYLQWLRAEMKYDGFRWDEAKGFDPKHIGEYNDAAEPYISFIERWSGTEDITWAIDRSGKRTMALDFQTKYSAFDGIAAFDYSRCKGSGLLGAGYAKYAVTFIDSHDWFYRGNGQEFGGNGNSLTPELKDRLLQANAFLLGMPGVPCVFYPHWYKYKEEIKDMINARHLAGVHSESEISDESADHDGYECTVHGKNGWLILQLGNRTKHEDQAWDANYKLIAKGPGYAMWVHALGDVAPGIIVTPDAAFEDKDKGIEVTLQAAGGSGEAVIYYTTDGTEPTTTSAKYTTSLTFKETTVLKVMAVCGKAKSKVQTYTYTYREPLKRGIRVRFKKPKQWEKVYYYAWIPGTDGAGNATSENIMGAYPGQRVYQDMDGWYSYEFDQSLTTVNFCISSGEDCGGLNVRSNDLAIDYDADYGWEEGFETESQYEILLDEGTVINPDFDLSISPESGNFSDKTAGMRVHINAVGKKGALVYYTTDGSDPSTCAEPVQDSVSFVIHETTTVRAYAYNMSTEHNSQEQTAVYTYKEPQTGPITVNFIKPRDWEKLYLYAFTRVKVNNKYKDTPYSLDGNSPKWPGMEWTTTTTINDSIWHTWTMSEQIKADVKDKDFYVIFTEGENKPQTQDIYLTESTCFVWRADCGKAVVSPDCDGASGIEEIIAETINNNDTYKIVTDDRIIIIRDGVMYDVLGRRL